MFCVLPAMSQKMILVKKDGTKYNAKFFVGDIISFKYCDGDNCVKIKGRINAIEDETMIVGYTSEFDYKKIAKIYIDRKAVQISQYVVGGAGAFYLGFTGINTLLTRDKVEMTTLDYVLPISAMAAAAAITPLNKRKYHLDKPHKYSLLVLDLGE
jgi:hypothetical protein